MDRLGRGLNQAKYGHDGGGTGIRSSFRRAIGAGGRRLDNRKDINALTDQTLTEERRNATNASLFDANGHATAGAIRAAGGDAAGGQRLADRARAGAEAEALKRALEPLTREIAEATARGENTDTFLSDRAHGRSADGRQFNDMERTAAMHKLAEMGRDDVLRNMRTEFASGPDGTGGDPAMALRLTQAIQANGGALAARAPDLVKPPAVAFSNLTGADLAAMSNTTMTAYMAHVQRLGGPAEDGGDAAAYQAATANLASAITDIANNTTLQSSFKGNSGAVLLGAAGNNAEVRQALGGYVQPDGKIRQNQNP